VVTPEIVAPCRAEVGVVVLVGGLVDAPNAKLAAALMASATELARLGLD